VTFRKFLALISVILGFFMALLDTTIVNIVLPRMTDDFHTTVERISWVVNGYNLAFAVLLLTASRLADRVESPFVNRNCRREGEGCRTG
jgi:MFS family permease